MNISQDSPSVDALAHYLHDEGFTDKDQLKLETLSGGQSNPTYLLSTGKQKYVLRKKPAGQLIASAHAIDREYCVMQAFKDSEVPVPRMVVFCEDESSLGTPFFLMEYLDGRILEDQSLPTMTPLERSAIYSEMNRVIRRPTCCRLYGCRTCKLWQNGKLLHTADHALVRPVPRVNSAGQ